MYADNGCGEVSMVNKILMGSPKKYQKICKK